MAKRNIIKSDFGRKPYYSGDYRDLMRSTTDAQIEAKAKQKHSEFKKPYSADFGKDYSDMEQFYMVPSSDVIDLDLPSQESDEPSEKSKSPWTVECRCMVESGGCYCAGATTAIGFNCYGSTIESKTADPIFTTKDEASSTITSLRKNKSGTISVTADSSASGDLTYNISLGSPCGETELVIPKCKDAECCNCAAVSIGYTSNTMATSSNQTLTASGATPGCNLSWSITSGSGSFDTDTGDSVVYTSPATNAECANNPTISLSCNGSEIDTLKIGVNASAASDAYAVGSDTGCNLGAPSNRYCHGTKNKCDATVTDGNFYWNGCSKSNYAECVALCPNPEPCLTDFRTAAMITGGCCPGALA